MTSEQKDFLSEQIERITPKLTSLLRRKFPVDQVEEILQEVFLDASRKVGILMNHPNPDGWFMVAVDLEAWAMRTFLAQETSMFTSFTEYQEFICSLPEDTIDEILPPETSSRDRMILKMYYELRMTTTEIGETLGVKPNNANQMLKRARTRLKKVLIQGFLLVFLEF